MLYKQNENHVKQLDKWRNEHKEDLQRQHDEHREDMARRDNEVNTALQTLAAFTVRLDNLEKR